MIHILLVDDDAFARSGLRLYLESLGYHIQEAADAQTGWDLACADPPPLAVLDVIIPWQSATYSSTPPTEPHGLALAQRLKKSYPTMGIVLLSAHQEFEKQVIHLAEHQFRSIAFLHKGGDMSRLHLALQEVRAGRTLFAAEVNKYVLQTAVAAHFSPDELSWIEQAVTELPRLSPREQEIAHLLSASYTPEAIAARLDLSKGSVDNIISRIYQRLGLADMKDEAPNLRPFPILIKACLLYDIQHSR